MNEISSNVFRIFKSLLVKDDCQELMILSRIYDLDKSDFLDGLERVINSIIDTKIASDQLYRIHLYLKDIQSPKKELDDYIACILSHMFFKKKYVDIISFFFKKVDDFRAIFIREFVSKLIQFNYNDFMDHCQEFEKITGESQIHIFISYFEKNIHKFNLFFEQMPVDTKIKICEAAYNYSSNVANQIESHIDYDNGFKEELEKHIYEDSPLIKAFINIPYSSYRLFPKFLELIIKNINKVPESYQKMIDKACESGNYYVLINLAQPGFKKQILSILSEHNSDYLLKEFLTLFKDDPEVNSLFAFI